MINFLIKPSAYAHNIFLKTLKRRFFYYLFIYLFLITSIITILFYSISLKNKFFQKKFC